jgi:hypothetical protein
MMTVRTKGVALKRELRKDEHGFDVFTLDDAKFDVFDVLIATLAKCGYAPPASDPKADACVKRLAAHREKHARQAREGRER